MELLIFRIIPKSLISRVFGYIALIPFPSSLMKAIMAWYCKNYGVNLDEAVIPEGGFRTLNEFFTRKLKPGIHNIASGKKTIVSTTDSRIDQFGDIKGDTIIQAKGIDYSLGELVPSEIAGRFINGKFVTLYLSPGDYHRIHSPVTGKISGFYNIPGKLYPVKESIATGLKNLFSINERIITYIETDYGLVGVCKVGAINVGKISLSYEDIVTNRLYRKREERFYGDKDRKEIGAGEEIGVFNLGSTVILLFEKGVMDLDDLEYGKKIRLGEKIGSFR